TCAARRSDRWANAGIEIAIAAMTVTTAVVVLLICPSPCQASRSQQLKTARPRCARTQSPTPWVAANSQGSRASTVPERERRLESLFDVLDKTVAIGHLHLWKRVRVDHVVLADDSVEVEKIGGNSISLVVRQRFRFLVRHGGEHVVEDGRGI